MSYIGTTDPNLDRARGLINGETAQIVQGHNLAVGTSIETIWSEGGLYSYLTAATVLKISSDNSNDVNTTGTGAWQVEIYGLDGSYAEQTETVNLNGTTAVNTANSYLRILTMRIISAGSSEENEGVIYAGTGTVTAGVPANKYGRIDEGYNHSMMTMWTIPAGKTGYVCNPAFGLGQGKTLDGEMVVRRFGEVFAVVWELHTYQQPVTYNGKNYWVVEEKGDIEIRAEVDAGNIEISAGFEVILIDN